MARTYGVAVIDTEEGCEVAFELFATRGVAETFARDAEVHGGYATTYWRSLAEPEYLASPERPGWRKVSYFL